VFERFPKLKFVMTEMGCAWIPPMLTWLDSIVKNVRDTGAIGELRFTEDQILQHTATEYFQQSCWVGASQPGPADAAVRTMMGDDRFMWGSDYPHDEGTGPFTTEHLRQVFSATAPDRLREILAGNAAKLYGFDLAKLAPLAEQFGPTVDEVAQPLTELPENANMALLRAAGAAA
jgi:predicted TIM-barrel fold metal-dependent hydrolase